MRGATNWDCLQSLNAMRPARPARWAEAATRCPCMLDTARGGYARCARGRSWPRLVGVGRGGGWMDDDERRRQRFERGTDPARVLALSDGVIAIIITLLVLEIHVPELTGGQDLREALREVRPSFVAFLISFVVVAIAWAGHRDQFALIRRTDRTLAWLNILYLLPLSVLPFATSLLARYDEEPVALRMYGICMVAIAVTRLIMWIYATGRPYLLFAPIDARSRWTGL